MVAERGHTRPVESEVPSGSNRSGLRPHPETSLEARFVTLCVREPDAVADGEIAASVADVRDWRALADLASRHRVAAYVLEATARAGIDLPRGVERELRGAALFAAAKVLRIDAELRRLIGDLEDGGIPVLVLKGPALVRTIYPRAALRPYGDVDLSVQERHQATAVRMLLRRGCVEIPFEAEEARREHAGHLDACSEFHRQFTSGDGEVLIELHIDPLQLGLRPTGEAARWQRTRAVPGLPGALMLGPEDQVVQLSAHVHKHGFDRLIWLKDLDLLLRAHRDRLDWELIERAARDEGVLGSVWYSLHLAQLLLMAPVPPGVLRRLRPSFLTRQLYGQVWPIARIAGLHGFMRRRAVQFHAAESWRGMLPSLILMGRRGTRARAVVQALLRS